MSKEKIQSLIDRVIGKDGILRVPSYWMRRLFNQILDYTDATVDASARKTEASAITTAVSNATATSKEYTDQQIAELGITGKEPVVYALPERIFEKVIDFKEYRFSYTLTEAEANEFWAAMDKGIDNIIFIIGRYSLVTPHEVAQVMRVTDNWYLLLGGEFVNGNGGLWYSWRPGVKLEFNASTREVEVEVVTTKTNIVDIQGMIDSSIGDINTILDTINGEEI